MSSAYSITAAVNPPRAVYLDYPLGHTSGRKDDRAEQLAIMRATLDAFANSSAGEITTLPFEWSADHSWKDSVMRPRPKDATSVKDDSHEDTRVARFDTPQYQDAEDESVADPECASCIFLSNSNS